MSDAAAEPVTGSRPVRIGTRASALARVQTEWVAGRLRDCGMTVQIEPIDTRGDARGDVPIETIGGDGVFVRELERALLEQRIDVAVHSMKDLPTAETPGLVIASVPIRATPFDAFVGRTAASLQELPAGAVVGTSSIRRVVQVRALRPDLVVRPVRGNVDTRLRKLDAGDFDGLILAAAGLERLGLGGRVTQLLAPPLFWPAVAQGALAIQARTADDRTRAALAPLDDPATHRAGEAERACLAALAGGCLAPIAAWARADHSGALRLDACVFEERDGGVAMLHAETTADGPASPAAVGKVVAGQLLARGAEAMLARMRNLAAPRGLPPPR